MKPKKKSSLEYFIAAGLLLIVVYFALHLGMAMTEAAAIEAEQQTAQETVQSGGAATFELVMQRFEIRLADSSLSFAFEWNENVRTCLMWGCFLWFIFCAYWFTSKKKYITGKEYGTAEWGTQKDISDLFAENIMKKELRQAKQVKTPIGRYFAKSEVYNACRKNVGEKVSHELAKLEQWKKQNLPTGKSLTKEQRADKKAVLKEYAKRKKEIAANGEEWFSLAVMEAWQPNKLKALYQQELADIEKQYQQRLVIVSEEQKKTAEREAKNRYNTAIKDFYNSKEKVDKIKKKYENADALFTKTERMSIYNYVLNNNTLILGGAGSGKTRGFVVPNILQAHSSFVITDPKGEILEKVGYFLEKVKGYKVRVLNLDDKTKSDCYNPFIYIHPERAGYEERVLALIEAIIINTDGGEKKSGSDPFWDKAERLFLQAIFFFVCDGFPIEERNMNTVLNLIGMLEISEEQDQKNSRLDIFARIFEENHGADHIGVQQYKEFRDKASGKTAKSIVISAVARLAPFRAREVRRIFNCDTMSLEALGEEKTAIFVVVPPTDTTFNFVAGMLFTQMFQELQYCATQVHKHDGQRLPVPVRFILDEFANTCTIPQFPKILAYARSFGIGIVPILQSLEQIKNMYKDEWGVIVDNCNSLLFLGSITHKDTLEYMSSLLGKGTFDKKTTGRTRGRSGSSSQNFDVIGRELMDAAEIRKLPKKDCLLVLGGRNPFYSEKYHYETHPNYKYTSDGNPEYSYEYTPALVPKSNREIENELTHREDEINVRVSATMEQVNAEVAKFSFNLNAQQILNSMGQTFTHLVPIDDNLLNVNDGEAFDEQSVFDILDRENEADEQLVAGIYEKVVATREKVEESVSENNLITNPVETLKRVVAIGENLAPAREEVTAVNDGEAFDAESFEFDESDEQDNAIAEEVGDMSSLLADLSEAMGDEEESEMEI